MFVELAFRTPTRAAAAVALLCAACGAPRVVPARAASEADVRAVMVAEAHVAAGRSVALDPSRGCEERASGGETARRGAAAACDTARRTDDRDLAARCASASRGAREASGVASLACGRAPAGEAP